MTHLPGFIASCLIGLMGMSPVPSGAAPFLNDTGGMGVGVYYFPGWKSKQIGAPSADPWARLKSYPHLKPQLGWYEEDAPGVLEQQLRWMKESSIQYVVFDWLWGPDNKPYLDHAVNKYLSLPDKHGVKFTVLWANHTSYVFSRHQLRSLFAFWSTRYLNDKNVVRINGLPAVYLFSADTFVKNALALGTTSAELIEMANEEARTAGLPGLAFVGGVYANQRDFDYSERSGFTAWTAYNYHGPATGSLGSPPRWVSHSYAELDTSYRDHWSWMVKNAGLPFVVPMTSGWDKRPWGGSSDPLHDQSTPTVKEFQRHLEAGKAFSRDHARDTIGSGIICCWNEFGEGSIIEPTQGQGMRFLQAVDKVFSATRP